MAVKTRRTSGRAAADQRGAAADAAEAFFPGPWLIGSYFVLAVVFFLPAMMPGVMLYGTDHLGEAYYSELFASERLGAGELPKWNPLIFGGVPFFANAMDTYYPITVISRLIGIPTHHLPLANFVVQIFLAGAGMFLLVRELGARRFAAYLAGLMYMFSGYIVSFILGGHDGRMIVATLAPLFFFSIHRAVRTAGFRWFVLTGIILGGAHLSNQIQSTYYLLLAGALWAAFILWHLDEVSTARSTALRLAGGAFSLVIGFGLSAVNYLPFLGYIANSPRGGEGGRGYDFATSWSMPPGEITGLAVPEHIGLLDAYWGANPFKLHTEYVGGLALLLLVAGFVLLRRNGYAWFFFGLMLFGLSISFGGYTPLYRLYYALLPGTDKFRAPSISFYLVSLAIVTMGGLALSRMGELRAELAERAPKAREQASAAVRIAWRTVAIAGVIVILWGLAVLLASPGADAATRDSPEALAAAKAALNHPAYVNGIWRFAAFFAVSAVGIGLWLRRKLTTRTAVVALSIVAITDLWIIDKKFFETVPDPSVTLAPDEIATFLASQPKPFRTFVLFDLPQDNYLTRFGIELVAGHHPNQLQSYNAFLGAGEQAYTDFHNMGDPRFLALANAKYLVSQREISAPFLKAVFQGRTRDGRAAMVYENSAVLPRAFLVATATQATGSAAALDRLRAPDFDPTREVVLDVDPPLRSEDSLSPIGNARVAQMEPSHVEVVVQAVDSAYLVLSDNYHDGWTATVDGESAPILRANVTFRAVVVPPGKHAVRFDFRPAALTAGFAISTGVWVLLLAYGVGLFVRSRRREKRSSAT